LLGTRGIALIEFVGRICGKNRRMGELEKGGNGLGVTAQAAGKKAYFWGGEALRVRVARNG